VPSWVASFYWEVMCAGGMMLYRDLRVWHVLDPVWGAEGVVKVTMMLSVGLSSTPRPSLVPAVLLWPLQVPVVCERCCGQQPPGPQRARIIRVIRKQLIRRSLEMIEGLA